MQVKQSEPAPIASSIHLIGLRETKQSKAALATSPIHSVHSVKRNIKNNLS